MSASTININLERQRLRDIAQEYEKKGYVVTLQPTSAALPPALASFQPDMIASNDQETVLVEVKTRQNLNRTKDLADLARVVNASPGWRLELVVTNPRTPVEADNQIATNEKLELSLPEIRDRIKIVRQLINMSQEEAATVLAWSAVEAVMRLVAKREDIAIERKDSLFLLKKLYSVGLLAQTDYELLKEGMEFRNLIVHGYKAPGPKSEFLSQILNKIEALIEGKIKPA